MGTTKTKSEGFTLIEVVLVLAIGGLIFLLAFLAFSQAQQNRRDSQRRTDARRMLGYIGEFAANNNGRHPCADHASFTNLATPFSSRIRATGGFGAACGMKTMLDTDEAFNVYPSTNFGGTSTNHNGYRDPSGISYYIIIENTDSGTHNWPVGGLWVMIGARCEGDGAVANDSSQTWVVRVKLENGRSHCASNA